MHKVSILIVLDVNYLRRLKMHRMPKKQTETEREGMRIRVCGGNMPFSQRAAMNSFMPLNDQRVMTHDSSHLLGDVAENF